MVRLSCVLAPNEVVRAGDEIRMDSVRKAPRKGRGTRWSPVGMLRVSWSRISGPIVRKQHRAGGPAKLPAAPAGASSRSARMFADMFQAGWSHVARVRMTVANQYLQLQEAALTRLPRSRVTIVELALDETQHRLKVGRDIGVHSLCMLHAKLAVLVCFLAAILQLNLCQTPSRVVRCRRLFARSLALRQCSQFLSIYVFSSETSWTPGAQGSPLDSFGKQESSSNLANKTPAPRRPASNVEMSNLENFLRCDIVRVCLPQVEGQNTQDGAHGKLDWQWHDVVLPPAVLASASAACLKEAIGARMPLGLDVLNEKADFFTLTMNTDSAAACLLLGKMMEQSYPTLQPGCLMHQTAIVTSTCLRWLGIVDHTFAGACWLRQVRNRKALLQAMQSLDFEVLFAV